MNAHHLLRAWRATCVRSTTRALILTAVVLCTACSWGTKASDIPWSQGPEGAPARVKLVNAGIVLTGELLTVDTSGVLLYTTVLNRIPWTVMRSFELRGLGNEYRVSGGAQPSIGSIHRLALVSHFPQGMEPAVLTKLLEAMNQKAVEDIR